MSLKESSLEALLHVNRWSFLMNQKTSLSFGVTVSVCRYEYDTVSFFAVLVLVPWYVNLYSLCTYSPNVLPKKKKDRPQTVSWLVDWKLLYWNFLWKPKDTHHMGVLDIFELMRRSHKVAEGRGPRCPGRRRSQRPTGRFCQSPWQRTSSRLQPVGQGKRKRSESC